MVKRGDVIRDLRRHPPRLYVVEGIRGHDRYIVITALGGSYSLDLWLFPDEFEVLPYASRQCDLKNGEWYRDRYFERHYEKVPHIHNEKIVFRVPKPVEFE